MHPQVRIQIEGPATPVGAVDLVAGMVPPAKVAPELVQADENLGRGGDKSGAGAVALKKKKKTEALPTSKQMGQRALLLRVSLDERLTKISGIPSRSSPRWLIR